MKYRRHKINPMYDLPIRYKNIMIRNYEIVHYLHIPGDLLNVRYTIIIFIGLNNNPQNIILFYKGERTASGYGLQMYHLLWR